VLVEGKFMVIFGFFNRLSERELRWIDRRMKNNKTIGIPDAIRHKIVGLGYGEPEGMYSFRLTEKGEEYLKKHGTPREIRG
jgi:hypothetical protein